MSDGIVRNGVPYEPDIQKLLEAFPIIEPGQCIEYAEVSRVLGAGVNSQRFEGVTKAWRARLLRRDNFVLDRRRGQGFVRLTEQERSGQNVDEFGRKIGQASRASRDMHRVSVGSFSERELATHTHRTNVIDRGLEALTSITKELAPPRAVRSLPRLRAVEE
jgi:hypothetical protein